MRGDKKMKRLQGKIAILEESLEIKNRRIKQLEEGMFGLAAAKDEIQGYLNCNRAELAKSQRSLEIANCRLEDMENNAELWRARIQHLDDTLRMMRLEAETTTKDLSREVAIVNFIVGLK